MATQNTTSSDRAAEAVSPPAQTVSASPSTSAQEPAPYEPLTKEGLANLCPRYEAPRFETLPLAGATFMIVYRHTHHAFFDVYGYDTEYIRFYMNDEGSIAEVRHTRLYEGGEKVAARYRLKREGQVVEVNGEGESAHQPVRYEVIDKALVVTDKDGDKTHYICDAPETVAVSRDRPYDTAKWTASDRPNMRRETAMWGRKSGTFYALADGWRYAEDFEGDTSHAEMMVVDAYATKSALFLCADAVEAIMEGAIVGEVPTGLKALELWALVNYLLGYESGLDSYIARLALGLSNGEQGGM